MRDIHITEKNMNQIHSIGRLNDNNSCTVYFDYLDKDTTYFLKLQKDGIDYMPIPLIKTDTGSYKWAVDLEYTYGDTPFSYIAETVEDNGVDYVENHELMKLCVLKSIGGDDSVEKEEIPENLKNLYYQMQETEQEFRDRLEHSGTGTSNYTFLSNKPKINGKELSGNLSAEDLGLAKDFNLGSGFKEEPGKEKRTISVNTALKAEQDNTLPITSAAVFAEIGNIDALLKTI